MSRPDGGPAFPFAYPAATDAAVYGMSLRDYFAAAMMPVVARGLETSPRLPSGVEAAAFAASMAYTLADAMLAERAK